MTDSGSPRTTPTRRGRARSRLEALVPARLRNRQSRGAAELSVLVVTGSLIAGVFFGQGISRTAVDVADGLTWLSDEPNGQIIQVNPATGQLEVKQVVGNPGDDIEVTGEHGGQLYVADHTSGRLRAFDLTSILVSGQRRISTGGAVDTIFNDDGVFLVDSEQSTISAMDPQTTDAIGTIWVAPSGLADAAVDGKGVIWALEDDGTLHQLSWSADQQKFQDDDDQSVDGSGEGSVLVAHDEGVTVFGPDQGMIAQVGTGHDLTTDAPKVIGKIYAPEKSPSDLVPVASADNSHVVLLSGKRVIEIDMASIACTKPGTPEVFRGEVWVPCTGQGRVVRLNAEGRRVARDLSTPGSKDPELILDDDNLVINAPGAPQGIVVHGDGSTSTIVREDAKVPTNGLTPATTPPSLPDQDLVDDLLDLGGDDEESEPPTPDPTNTPNTPDSQPSGTPPTGTPPGGGGGGGGDTHGGGGGGGGGNNLTPTTCTPSSTPTSWGGGGKGGSAKPCSPPTGSAGQPVTAPTDVVAEAMAEGQVRVSWRHSGLPKADGFVIRSSTGKTYPGLKGWVREAFVDVTPGQPTTFTVTAVHDDSQSTSYPSNTVTSTARPGAPTVTGTATYQGNDDEEIFVVDVKWQGAKANGKPIATYDVAVTVAGDTRSQQVSGGQSSAKFTWTCSRRTNADCKVGGDFQATVMARNELGSGAAGVVSGTAPAQPPPPLPDSNRQIVDGSSPRSDNAADDGSGSIDLKLRAPDDWFRFPGTCTYVLDANPAQPVACNATKVTIAYANGVIYQPNKGTVDHRVIFYATNPRGTATSSGYSFTTKQTPQVVPPPDPEPSPEQPGCSPQPCQIP
ncbi:hypothetical protein [Nocardioides plantarum]|uniref:Fibronectin type-III domain-containing protein n=2 Tax=Nocardioides plantarum TaxID=29299 RepID=A0ABV5K5X9_9ACTN|nr:hypothetical protein [Nocardioides plantarum]